MVLLNKDFASYEEVFFKCVVILCLFPYVPFIARILHWLYLVSLKLIQYLWILIRRNLLQCLKVCTVKKVLVPTSLSTFSYNFDRLIRHICLLYNKVYNITCTIVDCK